MNVDEHEHGTDDNFIKGTKKLSLEKYCTFLASADLSGFTMRNLNTVLSIHGIKQMSGKKEQLMEAVRKIELKDFSRCTLGEAIQPAPMFLSNVVRDLAQLNWQACPVVSLRSITSPHCSTKSIAVVTRTPLKKGNKKKKKKMKQLSGPVRELKSQGINGRSVSGLGDNSTGPSVSGAAMTNGTSGSSSAIPGKNPNSGSKRKRKAIQKGLDYLSSGAMPNLSLELGIFN